MTIKKTFATGLATAALIAVGGIGVLGATAQAAPVVPAATPTFAPAATIDAKTAAELAYMREEERVARDLYTALDAQYGGNTVFSRIKNSEQQHFDTMGLLLQRYGLKDPSAGLTAGTYADPTLQALYDKLLAQGKTSLPSAYDVGVAVEKTDIADLTDAIAASSDSTVDAALGNLQRASQNHLSAFERAKTGQTVGTGNGRGGPNGQGMNRTGTNGQGLNGTAQRGRATDTSTTPGGRMRGQGANAGTKVACPLR